jgi:hypothetical protein
MINSPCHSRKRERGTRKRERGITPPSAPTVRRKVRAARRKGRDPTRSQLLSLLHMGWGISFSFSLSSPIRAPHEADRLDQREGEGEGEGERDREAYRERQRQRECARVRAAFRSTWYLCPPQHCPEVVVKESLLGPCSLLMAALDAFTSDTHTHTHSQTHTHTTHTHTDNKRGSGGSHAQGQRPRTQTHRRSSRAACDRMRPLPVSQKTNVVSVLNLVLGRRVKFSIAYRRRSLVKVWLNPHLFVRRQSVMYAKPEAKRMSVSWM